MKRLLICLLLSSSIFADNEAMQCAQRIKSFLGVEDNEAITLTGKARRDKDCFLDIFTRVEHNSEDKLTGELVTTIEVQGKKRGVSTAILNIDNKDNSQRIYKCDASEKKLTLSFSSKPNKRERFYFRISLNKNKEGKIDKAKMTKQIYSYDHII